MYLNESFLCPEFSLNYKNIGWVNIKGKVEKLLTGSIVSAAPKLKK